jgi:hypothetical protein
MNIKRAIFALGMALGLSVLASQSFAQGVICQPINNGTQWPNGPSTKACSFDGLNNPSDSAQMLSALQEVADRQWDIAARLKGFVVTAGDIVRIRIKNDNIADPDGNNRVTVRYKVKNGDHLSDVARGLAKDINDDPDLQAAGFSASAFGTQVFITAPPTGNTKYTGLVNPGATETITVTPDGVATLAGTTEHPFGTFYIFSNNADYFSSNEPTDGSGGTVAMDPDLSGNTPVDFDTLQPIGWSVVLQQDGNGHSRFNTPNTTIHELGHWADYIYANTGVLPSAGTQIRVKGTATPGDEVSIRITNANLQNGFQIVSYTVQPGDTLENVVLQLSLGIIGEPKLTNKKFSATTQDDGDGLYLMIYSDNNKPTLYQLSTSAGATEVLTQLADNSAIKSTLWRAALATDWQIINGQFACSYYTVPPTNYGNGIFSFRKDPQGNYFCDNNPDPNLPAHSPGNGVNLQGYSGSNKAIMEAAWPDFFTAGNQLNESSEIWAEHWAVLLGFTDWKYKSGPNAGQEDPIYLDRNFQLSDYIYHNNQFTCTRDLIFNLATTGEAKITPGAGAHVGEPGVNETFIACPSTP